MTIDNRDLTYLIKPRSVALIGASDNPNSIGGRTLANLVEHSVFPGDICLINPQRETVGGRPCYKGVADLRAVPDAVIAAVPAAVAVPALEEGGRLGVGFALVCPSGFAEG